MQKIAVYLKKNYILQICVVTFFAVIVIFVYDRLSNRTTNVLSATYYELRGHAWSETVGWISVNCLDGSSSAGNICATSTYKVESNIAGTLSGYAWSDNVGWISFNENSGCPSSPCRPVLDAGGLTGWARVTSAFYPTDPNPDRGGWDGWIKLDSTSPVYKVTRVINDLAGSAWGDINLGWLSFNCIDGDVGGANVCGSSNYKVLLNPITVPDPTLVFTVPTNAVLGDIKTLTWSTTNVDTCTASGAWSGSKSVPSGTQSTGPLNTQGPITYTMNCLNTVYNLPISATRVINVSDGICNVGETFAANPFDCTSIINTFASNPKIVKEGKSSKLQWNITAGQNCKLYNPSNVLLQSIPNGNNIGSYTIATVTGKSTYKIVCDGGVESYATVSVYLLYEY